jgi:hypothetical protein
LTAYDTRTAAEVSDFLLQLPFGDSFRNVEIGPTGKLYSGLRVIARGLSRFKVLTSP